MTKPKITISWTKRSLKRDGERVDLTHQAFKLLYYMIKHRGEYLSKERLKNDVWSDFVGKRTVDAHVSKIRKKLGKSVIKTMDFGYAFNVEEYEGEIDDTVRHVSIKGDDKVSMGIVHKDDVGNFIVPTIRTDSQYGELIVYRLGEEWHAVPENDFKLRFSPIEPKFKENV